LKDQIGSVAKTVVKALTEIAGLTCIARGRRSPAASCRPC